MSKASEWRGWPSSLCLGCARRQRLGTSSRLCGRNTGGCGRRRHDGRQTVVEGAPSHVLRFLKAWLVLWFWRLNGWLVVGRNVAEDEGRISREKSTWSGDEKIYMPAHWERTTGSKSRNGNWNGNGNGFGCLCRQWKPRRSFPFPLLPLLVFVADTSAFRTLICAMRH